MKGIHLLIIEEHMAVRNALETRLRSAQTISTVTAVNALDVGLDYVQTQMPGVVLLGCKGNLNEELVKLTDVVRQMVKANTAVIIFAPYANEIEREALLQAGASRYLLKNINTPQLINEIETAVNKKKWPDRPRFSEYAIYQAHLSLDSAY
ncbi:MAG: response regulator transcription factor [Ardenticatenaceae bacterium]|nr:response regulator transcription factor [Anaerolineales bacterium]MCB8923413.1 response regulator transcription factor [Ardenticatenaceae bacterium]MCB9003862.1 response regulator transcription factor [Ardenticatenaceae bacterium]